ncbi:MAG: hypothetical protein FD149_1265 [Rhodospirillaceae bacterium]|nr:MAG: hypothetical protein FD149_1265 [Rhodospirillaceae bacterium]
MAKQEWGAKRICPSCDARFYDLRRNPILCPKCNTIVEPEAPPRLQRPVVARKAVKPVVTTPVVADLDSNQPDVEKAEGIMTDMDNDTTLETDEDDTLADEEDDDEEEEEALIEDASDLGADDDDVAEVMEHLEDDHEV